jgi:hypothetical protein
MGAVSVTTLAVGGTRLAKALPQLHRSEGGPDIAHAVSAPLGVRAMPVIYCVSKHRRSALSGRVVLNRECCPVTEQLSGYVQGIQKCLLLFVAPPQSFAASGAWNSLSPTEMHWNPS